MLKPNLVDGNTQLGYMRMLQCESGGVGGSRAKEGHCRWIALAVSNAPFQRRRERDLQRFQKEPLQGRVGMHLYEDKRVNHVNF